VRFLVAVIVEPLRFVSKKLTTESQRTQRRQKRSKTSRKAAESQRRTEKTEEKNDCFSSPLFFVFSLCPL
jgi:hypothetical protein